MEIWKNLPSIPEYFLVSNLGRVWSKRTEKVVKPTLLPSGYLALSTKIGGRKGQAFCKRIHREVAFAFLENHENKPDVNHKDGNKTNNKAENLEWVTPKENNNHAKLIGLINTGPVKRSRKLSQQDVDDILKTYKPFDREFGSRAMAKKYNVNKTTITYVVKNKGYLAA